MGKYDKIFNSKKTSEQSLSSEEAVAAIAVISAVADSSLEDVDAETLADILWEFEIFEEYSDDDLLEMVHKLIAIADDEGIGALFNASKSSLSKELVVDAYAAGASVLVDEEELTIPKGKKSFLKKLQEVLEIEDEVAKEVIDEIIASFEELEDEEYPENENGILIEEEEITEDTETDAFDAGFVAEDSILGIYESPLGNFTVPIPIDPQQGGRVQSQEGVVGFSDDLGTLLRIDYYPLPSEQIQEMASMGQEKYLRSIILDRYVPQAIVANLPDAQVKYTEYLKDTMEGAYFALVDMPKGSTISKQQNNGSATRFDAYRGIIAFTKDEFLYVVGSQRSFFEKTTPGSVEEEAERIKHNILDFVRTIQFA